MKNITETERSLGALLRLPFQRLVMRVYGELAATGFPDIRPAHGNVFRYIRPEGSRITEMAERAQIAKQSMGYLVDYLRDRGYVTLIPDPRDARAKLVRLTERGEAVQRAALEISRQVEREWAAWIGEREMALLRDLLERLGAHLDPGDAGE